MNLPGWQPAFADSPLFHALRPLATDFARQDHWPSLAQLDALAEARGIRNARGLPIRFQHQERKCGQRQYEDGIHAEGRVPTRADNWHDLFNALIWLAYPLTKATLNATQHRALAALRDGRRGPLADAATLFDESGVVLAAPDRRLADALAARQWHHAFWELRDAWRNARVHVIGHSLLEKALTPQRGITGKCLFIQLDSGTTEAGIDHLDAQIAQAWQTGGITTPRDLFPLPLAGIPDWHADNGEAGFYQDERVFRRAANPR